MRKLGDLVSELVGDYKDAVCLMGPTGAAVGETGDSPLGSSAPLGLGLRLYDVVEALARGESVSPEALCESLPERYVFPGGAIMATATPLVERRVPCGLAERILSAPLEDTEAVSSAAALRADGCLLGVIGGPVGCGKSFAAAWWMRTHPDGQWRASADVAALRSEYAWREMDMLVRCRALVLEDVGIGDVLDGRLVPGIQQILARRVDAKLPTLLTTGLLGHRPAKPWNGVVMEEIFDERLRDRWFAEGRFCGVPHRSLRQPHRLRA